jgi:serine/threonine protein kinase
MGRAKFRLVPRKAPSDGDLVAFTEERLSFVRQPVPEVYEGTYEDTLERLSAFDLQSLRSSRHNTRMNTPFQPEPDKEIRYTVVRSLGQGGQGNVYKVVDMYSGDHYACKRLQFQTIPEWEIYNEKAFKKKVHDEVNRIMKLRHVYFLSHSQLLIHAYSYIRIILCHMCVAKDGQLDET